MRYLILGPLEVRDGDGEVEVRGGQQRKLLAILLLRAGEALSSDLLIEELWDGKPPETAAKALQGYVSGLRKQLGPESIETVGAAYRLNVASEDTDSGSFEELLAEARPLERAQAVVKLREALALWRGPALADFAYDGFARQEIERLEELRLSAVERRIDLELALGHHDDLVPELEALVHAYPLRERFRGHLMVALYRSGRQAEALEAFQDARNTLRDELGLEPSEDLQVLQRSILDHDPALAAPPRVDPPAAALADQAPKTRRLPLVAVAVGLALLTAAAVATALILTRNATAVVVPPNSVARIDPAGTRIESYVGVGTDPVAIAVGLGGVWVANSEDGTVSKLDPSTGKYLRTIGAGGGDLNDIAVGFGSVWVANGNDGTITKIDPRLGQPGPPIPLGPKTLAPDPVFYIATDAHYVWVTRGDKLLRIDPKTDRVDPRRLNIGTPTGLAAGGGSVWVTTQSERLWRIDPRTLKGDWSSLSTLSNVVLGPVFARRSLWLIAFPEVRRIDPSSLDGSALAVPAGLHPRALAWGGGSLWSTGFRGSVTRLVGSGGPTKPMHVGANLSAIAVGAGATWVAVSGAN